MNAALRIGGRLLAALLLAVAAPTLVAPAAIAQTVTSQPADEDSYVDSSVPTGNFGSLAYLRADASPDTISYVKFVVGSVLATPVKLGVFPKLWTPI